ncbi:MAG: DUF389 domain-containing protein [Akkermansiaceae bacterium]
MLLVIRRKPEAAAMVRWGVRIAKAKGSRLHILWLESGREQVLDTDLEWETWGAGLLDKEPEWEVISDSLADCGELEVKLCKANTKSRHLTVLALERSLVPSLIIVGRHVSERNESVAGKLAHELLTQAYSNVLVLRLGNLLIDEPLHKGILVPCSGGKHSRLGLQLASNIAGTGATAFFVQADTDTYAEDVGHERLKRTLQRAKVSQDDVSQKVVLSSKVSAAISDELLSGEYGLLLIGNTDAGTLRRKLFGTVPENLIKGDDGLSIGVIRAARPVGHRIREKFENTLNVTLPQLSRDERIQLFAEIEGKARWSFDFAALMVLATTIAGLGLLADSAAVVIGAMLVAPLMTPLLGGGLAVVQGNLPLWKRSQKAVLLGFFSALFIGLILGVIARCVGMGMTGELLARGEPTPLDLGVAFFSGIAASYCLARPQLSSALAGVAIAAALVPPIATTGICLALGENAVAKGAGLLFGTNVVAIVLGSGLNFFLAGIRGKKSTPRLWSRRLVIVLTLVCAGLCVPLASVLISKIPRSAPIEKSLSSALTGDEFSIIAVKIINPIVGNEYLEIHLEGPDFPSDATMEAFRNIAAERYGDGTEIRIRMTFVRKVGPKPSQ